MSYLSVTRDPVKDRGWYLDAPIVMDEITYDAYINDPSSILVVFVVYDRDGSPQVVFGHESMTADSEFPNVIHFTKFLKNREDIDVSGNLRIDTEGKIVHANTATYINDSYVYIDSEIKIDIITFMKGVDAPNNTELHQMIISNVTNQIASGYNMVASYSANGSIKLAEDYTHLFRPYIEPMQSAQEYYTYAEDIPKRYLTDVFDKGIDSEGNMVITPIHTAGEIYKVDEETIYLHRAGDIDYNRLKPRQTTYKIFNVPAVRSVYMLNTVTSDMFYKHAKQTKTEIESDSFIKTSRMTIMMKYMNCFGNSSEYLAYAGNDSRPLSHVDMSLEFRAKFKPNVSSAQVTQTLKYMQADIKNSVNATNKDSTLRINNITTVITTKYKVELDKFEFVSINGLDTAYQSIDKIETSSETSTGDFIIVGESLDRGEFMKGNIVFIPNIHIIVISGSTPNE